MPYTVTIESFAEFKSRHSEQGPPIKDRNLVRFPDGATVLESDANMRSEPPQDERQLLTLQRDYHKAWLQRIHDDFNKTQATFTGQAQLALKYQDYVGPPENADEILGAMEAASDVHLAKLQQIESRLAQLQPETTDRWQAASRQIEDNRVSNLIELQRRMWSHSLNH